MSKPHGSGGRPAKPASSSNPAPHAPDAELRHSERYSLRNVDEIGYLPSVRPAANLLFVLDARRYGERLDHRHQQPQL